MLSSLPTTVALFVAASALPYSSVAAATFDEAVEIEAQIALLDLKMEELRTSRAKILELQGERSDAANELEEEIKKATSRSNGSEGSNSVRANQDFLRELRLYIQELQVESTTILSEIEETEAKLSVALKKSNPFGVFTHIPCTELLSSIGSLSKQVDEAFSQGLDEDSRAFLQGVLLEGIEAKLTTAKKEARGPHEYIAHSRIKKTEHRALTQFLLLDLPPSEKRQQSIQYHQGRVDREEAQIQKYRKEIESKQFPRLKAALRGSILIQRVTYGHSNPALRCGATSAQ